jgi:hypothetical protein
VNRLGPIPESPTDTPTSFQLEDVHSLKISPQSNCKKAAVEEEAENHRTKQQQNTSRAPFLFEDPLLVRALTSSTSTSTVHEAEARNVKSYVSVGFSCTSSSEERGFIAHRGEASLAERENNSPPGSPKSFVTIDTCPTDLFGRVGKPHLTTAPFKADTSEDYIDRSFQEKGILPNHQVQMSMNHIFWSPFDFMMKKEDMDHLCLHGPKANMHRLVQEIAQEYYVHKCFFF